MACVSVCLVLENFPVHLAPIYIHPVPVWSTNSFLAFHFPSLTPLCIVCFAHYKASLIPLPGAISSTQCKIRVSTNPNEPLDHHWNLAVPDGMEPPFSVAGYIAQYSQFLDVCGYPDMLWRGDAMTNQVSRAVK